MNSRQRVVVAMLVLSSTLARAQSDRELAARAAFEAGTAALQQGDLEEAETQFRMSLESSPRSSTALNLALVLEERQEFQQSVVIYDELLEGEYGELPLPRADISAHRERAASHLGTVELTAWGADDVEVLIDGIATGRMSSGQTRSYWIEPGEHDVAIRTRNAAATSHVEIVQGTRTPITLRLLLPDEQATDEQTMEQSGEQAIGDVIREPVIETSRSRAWLGWVVGAIGLVTAVAVTAVVLRRSDSQPFEEEVPRVSALQTSF